MLSHGDSKTSDRISSMKVYGDGIEIRKEDCVNHVSKGVDTAL